jgi:hypothetical protein
MFIMPDQREAGREQRIDRAEQQAADDHLNKDGGHAGRKLCELDVFDSAIANRGRRD